MTEPYENWETLIAIADHAGESWGERARKSAINLSLAADNDEDNQAILLLRNIDEVFSVENIDRISSEKLCVKLCEIEESPWSEFGWDGMNPRKLARSLKPFGIRPDTHRINGKPKKGYLFTDFNDAFLRYLGKVVTPLQLSNGANLNYTDKP